MTVSTILRGVAVVALALTLASCGGKASFPITGSVNGLIYDGLVLNSNGMDLPLKAGTTSFSFPNSLSYGEVYNVTQKTPPAHQNCTPTDQRGLAATDTAGRLPSISIFVSCTINTATIGGNLYGLTVDGLVLTNGTAGGTVTLNKSADKTAYTFPAQVAYSQSYGVTVLTQPAGLFCTVANPTGVMGDTKVENIDVTCVPKT